MILEVVFFQIIQILDLVQDVFYDFRNGLLKK